PDPDLPANALVYSLSPGAPVGVTLDATTGVFSWTPTEAQGPADYGVTVRVTDNGTPALSDSKTITIHVGEVNVAPVLAAIGDRSVSLGSPLTFTAGATDADLPAYLLRLTASDGALSRSDSVQIIVRPLVAAAEVTLPIAYALEPGFPNPFRNGTHLDFALPEPSRVRLTILDAQGRAVAEIEDGVLVAGRHQRVWNGRDRSGSPAPAGLYFASFEARSTASPRHVSLVHKI